MGASLSPVLCPQLLSRMIEGSGGCARWRPVRNLDMVSAIAMESSWLFIRRHETVRVFRPGPAWLHVAIAGPGGTRSVLRFATEAELQDFQASHEQQLIADGWHLAGTNVERRSGSDRRSRTRGDDRRNVSGGNGGDP